MPTRTIYYLSTRSRFKPHRLSLTHPKTRNHGSHRSASAYPFYPCYVLTYCHQTCPKPFDLVRVCTTFPHRHQLENPRLRMTHASKHTCLLPMSYPDQLFSSYVGLAQPHLLPRGIAPVHPTSKIVTAAHLGL